jgi:succinate-semialdehyde dehydrogenase/glutarate-semialdehyde dehydrogenase
MQAPGGSEPTIIDLTPNTTTPPPTPEPLNGLGPRRASHNPATGAVLGHVPLVGRDGIEAALAATREAQRLWAEQPPRQRAALLLRFRDELEADADAVAQLISMEQGKPIAEALSIELLSTLAQVTWLAGDGVKLLEGRATPLFHPIFTTKRARYEAEPLGVIAVISPWNYPFSIPATQVLTALLAGNGVILKPSPFTPLIGQKIAELARRAGLPSGLLSVIHIEDADAPYLTSHPGVDKIIFTGSVETGRRVMASAAQVPTPVVLELGGKDAAIVAPDADLKRAVPGIVWYAMANAGQTCAGIERAYVHSAIYDRFVDEAVALAGRLKVGEGIRQETEMGPLTNERQLAHIEALVEDAKAKGARVLVGGYRLQGEGTFYAPTVLVDVTPEMRLMQEEAFGPLLPILRVDSVEEAVESANQSRFALTGSIWTRDERKGLELARRLRGGAVNLNDHAFHYGDPGVGWGGNGASGFGRTNGAQGLMELVNLKFISADMRRGALELWWYPYNEALAQLLRNVARFLYGPRDRKLWAMVSLLLNPRTLTRLSLRQLLAAFRASLR